jgi:hypothetical protein
MRQSSIAGTCKLQPLAAVRASDIVGTGAGPAAMPRNCPVAAWQRNTGTGTGRGRGRLLENMAQIPLLAENMARPPLMKRHAEMRNSASSAEFAGKPGTAYSTAMPVLMPSRAAPK